MKWLYYSILVVSVWLLVVVQTSFLTALGTWGASLHPVLWCVIFMSFFNKKNLWAVVILAGFMLDIMTLSFGMQLLSLSVVALSLNIVHRHHLALHNLFSLLLSGIVGIITYLLSLFIINHSLGIIWRWQSPIILSWENILIFILLNILFLSIIFGLYKSYIYYINGRRY